MKKFGLLIIALYFTCSMGCVIVHDDDSSFTVANDSEYVISRIWIIWSDGYRDEVLGGSVLYPGDSMTVHDLECGNYDIEVQDLKGYSCTLVNENLCFDNGYWRITNYTLDVCAK